MVPQDDDRHLELRDYLRVLRRRRSVVVLVTLFVPAVALIVALLQSPVYEGTAEVLLQGRSTESLFNPNTGEARDPARAVETQLRVLKSRPVEAAVRQRIGGAPPVSARAVGQTDVIEVRAQSTDPQRSADVSNAYANAYIEFRRKQAVEDVLAAGQEVQAKVTDLQKQIDQLNAQLVTALPADRQQVEEGIAPTRQALVAQQTLFKQKLDQLQVDAALKTGGAQLVTPATATRSPIKPKPLRSGVLGVIAGLILGTGLAFLAEYLDDSITSKEDVERVAAVPTLGLIPLVPGWKDRKQPLVVSATDPKAPAAEAYRSLRTSIQFMSLDRPMRTIQVTSASAAEGKSTTIANLGIALAQAGGRVAIVCCDLRRPRIHEFFGLTNNVGFTSVLLGDVELDSALQEVPGVEARLRLLASGPIPPNPSELLASRRTVEVLTAVQAKVDVVLLDCPPVLPVTDAAVLSSRVDATLLVATASSTTRKELNRAHELLAQVDAPLIGTVLNGVTAEGSYGYSYRYSYSQDGNLRKTDDATKYQRRGSTESKPEEQATVSVPGRRRPEA